MNLTYFLQFGFNLAFFFFPPATVQIRPQVIAQGMPGQVQNVQIIQGPQGQLQVRGLLPGNSVFFVLI